jgi:bifunctional polynucleotide phosphatase/kinase
MWYLHETMLVYQPQRSATRDRWACFDLDWTLIRPVDALFSYKATRWAWLPWRLETINHLYNQGYNWAIFTNQQTLTKSGVPYKGRSVEAIRDKLQAIVDSITSVGLPEPYIFASLADDYYRKPRTGMWNIFTSLVNVREAFYCGDASGNNSWSDVDLMFAHNNGIEFRIPTQVFPSVYEYPNQYFPEGWPTQQEMWIFVGMPGAGKTRFYQQYLAPQGWIHINRDILKTKTKMFRLTQEALQRGLSVAIDNTNPHNREEWIALAQKYNVPYRILHFVRDGHTDNKFRENKVPDVAYYSYFKNLIEPTQNVTYIW